jgi:hypothetical protein
MQCAPGVVVKATYTKGNRLLNPLEYSTMRINYHKDLITEAKS